MARRQPKIELPTHTETGAKIAWDRWSSVPGNGEAEPCQRSTPGCCVDHEPGTDHSCDTW
jgi:hypothetical protein